MDLLYKFILDKGGEASKSDVINYMENDVEEKYRISRDTTMKEIEAMEREGIVIVSKPERRGLPHYLYINYKNVYNQISKSVLVIDRLIRMSEEPFKRITDLLNEHEATHGGELESDCHDCQMISGLVVTFFREWDIFLNRGLDFLLYRTKIHINDPNMQWNLYSTIIVQKIKFFSMLYDSPLGGYSETYFEDLRKGVSENSETFFEDLKKEAKGYAKNSMSYFRFANKEAIEYAKRNGMPIDAMIKQSQEILNIYKEEIPRPMRKIKK